MKVLVVGFGRMGLSHSIILSSLCTNFDLTIVDPSFFSRLVSGILFKNSRSFKPALKSFDKLSKENFDLVLITTPPGIRDVVISKFSYLKDNFVFIEKPVLTDLSENQMSGYVLQHSPMNNILISKLSSFELTKVKGKVVTNLQFGVSIEGWRSGKYGNVLYEFCGHVLSVLAVCLPDIFKEKHFKSLQVSKNKNNETVFNFKLDNILFEIELISNNSGVRKTSYLFQFFDLQHSMIEYDFYSVNHIMGDKLIFTTSISEHPISCPFYIRGFEFTNQMLRLLNRSGDIISSDQISLIEGIIKLVGEKS